METKIDLSPEALKKHREIAEKATKGDWYGDQSSHGLIGLLTAEDYAHITASSPDFIFAMLDEIERLRKERDWIADRFVKVCKNPELYQCYVLCDPEIICKERLLICARKTVEEMNAANIK